MNDLRLSIRQTYAAIGIHSEPSRLEINSSPGEQAIEQPAAKMEFESTSSKLTIDSTEAWHALGHGPNLEWNSGIYSQMPSIFLQQLARKVEEGRRMADITNPRSAFADLAKDALFRSNPVNYQIKAPGYNNVKVEYEPGTVHTEIEASAVQIDYTPHRPEIKAQRGNFEIYMRQKNEINIQVTPYDWYK
ncbi:hypothetical protein H8B09_18795 [Paenibacillus sp. PR3]|uniref:Uncharacterized protein n=1 Tax=Paenibacillus terricola TaxID=2763503 RepID=A0ABR8MY03_9BACL|nr:DUF6470 family protein [Paenibacillus terricola]MBD3920822.1 hypothetical protein [Paenibacillus terricola]